MGCLSAKIRRIGSSIRCEATKLSLALSILLFRQDTPITISATRASAEKVVQANRICSRIKVNCGLVCSVNHALILKVEPEYIWLMESNNFTDDVVVWSNVEWHVS